MKNVQKKEYVAPEMSVLEYSNGLSLLCGSPCEEGGEESNGAPETLQSLFLGGFN